MKKEKTDTWADHPGGFAHDWEISVEIKEELAAISDCLRYYRADKKTEASPAAVVQFDEAGIYKPYTGRRLQNMEQKYTMADRLGSRARQLVSRVLLPYIELFMDALDREIESNRKKEYAWLFRTTKIDRDAVRCSYKGGERLM